MKLTVLGSNASSPSRTNPASGYLLESNGTSIWMDAGPGTFMALSERMDPGHIDAVVLSHTHIDHCADLLALYSYLAYGPSGPTPVPVYAPVGTRELFAAFVRANENSPFHHVFTFHEMGAGESEDLGAVGLTVGEAVHPVPALILRFDDGSSSLVYSGDTGPGGDLIALASGATVLLCEATLQGLPGPNDYPYHMTAAGVGEVAAWSGVDLLVLTHIPARLDPQVSIDEASGAFVGPIRYAEPGVTFEVGKN